MLIALILLFLILSALFSGTEIAFISASKLRVEIERDKGSRQGTILARFFDNPADFLGTMLVGNNIALVVFTYLMTQLINPFIEPHITSELFRLLFSTILITFVVLIFGEFFPKTFFRLYANELLHFLAYPLAFITFVLTIPAGLMTKLSNFILRLVLKTPVENVEQVFTRLDLENYIKDTRVEDSTEEIDTTLFEKALYLKKTKVKECMVPRTEIEEIDVTASIDELKSKFQESNLSRLIVTNDDIDNVLGYVHHLQILKNPKKIEEMILKIPIVPEVMRVHDLMNRLIKERINIACVVDEYGGTAGIITLEDILEEIFGEIEDEHDQEDYVEVQVSENEYIFSGRLEIDYLNEKYEALEFPDGEYATLSGYLVMTTESIPKQNAEIELEGYRYILELVSDTKIETVRVIKLKEDV